MSPLIGSTRYHLNDNSDAELVALLGENFSEFEIIEKLLPHDLGREHGILSTQEPMSIPGNAIN